MIFVKKRSVFMFLTLAAVLIMTLGAVGGPVFAENANLIKNPGFEQLTNNFPTDWAISEGTASADMVKVEVSNQQPHSGSNCIKIQNDAMRDSMAIQTVNVKKDTVYQLSCWIRSENILNEAGSANITLYYDNNGIDCKGIITSTEFQNTNNQWTKLEFKFRTLKINSPFYVGVRLGGQGTVNQGIAYFDDLTLQESNDTGDLLTFFIPGNSGSTNTGTTGSGPNKVIIYVILGILAIGLLVFMESKLGKKGKKNESEEEAEDESEEEEGAEDEEVEEEEEESEDDEVQDEDQGKKKKK